MSDSPDAIRADIERTRQELGGDVDALVDKVTPSKIVGRQTDRVRDAFRGVSDRVMGAADDASSNLSDAGTQVGDAKDKLVSKAQGNPLAVGLIAFGVGLVAASLIPASAREREAASNIKDAAQPLIQKVGDAAKESAQHLKEPAQQAAQAVKDSASDSVDRVSGQAQQATESVRGQTQQARDNVSDA